MTAKPRRRWFRFSLRTLFVVVTLLAAASAVVWSFLPSYPYGWSHCCDIGLTAALHAYAESHGGNYPAGEVTPEASLSLLYPNYADANLLRGKSVPEATVQAILSRGGKLGPSTCGWHYVEGLNVNDDPRLAVLWDKNRLGHNGERSRYTMVLLVNDGRRVLAADEWDAFLIEQQELLAARVNQTKELKP